MRLENFTRIDGTEVFVNPDHVVAVYTTQDGNVRIVTDANLEAGPFGVTIREQINHVVQRLSR